MAPGFYPLRQLVRPWYISGVEPETRERWREAFWQSLGAGDDAVRQLLALCTPLPPPCAPPPLADEPHVAFYRELPTQGSALVAHLAEAFPQLSFSPAEGLSQTPEWVQAVRRGEPREGRKNPSLQAPEALTLQLLPTPAGTLPVLIAGFREDFVRLVQLLAHRGEPVPIPDSMGACLLQGLNNWQRYRALRQQWEEDPKASQSWEQMLQRKELYQDRLVLASRGPYSGVQVPESSHKEDKALVIRLNHEAAHYLTLRVFGKLGHTVLEELVADWYGLQAAYGNYDAELALRFLGLEAFPVIRLSGRLNNYRGMPPLSDEAFQFLGSACCRAANFLSKLGSPQEQDKAFLLVSLLQLSLEELAAGEFKAVPSAHQKGDEP